MLHVIAQGSYHDVLQIFLSAGRSLSNFCINNIIVDGFE